MHANVLLGSAKPGHIEPSGRSAVKNTGDSYQGEGCIVNLVSTNFV